MAAKHEKKMMQRLLEKSTDKELDDMLHEDHGPHWMDHHIKIFLYEISTDVQINSSGKKETKKKKM